MIASCVDIERGTFLDHSTTKGFAAGGYSSTGHRSWRGGSLVPHRFGFKYIVSTRKNALYGPEDPAKETQFQINGFRLA